jgi:hypothetical protein
LPRAAVDQRDARFPRAVQVGLIDPEAVDQLRRVKDEPAFVAGQRLDEFVVAAGGEDREDDRFRDQRCLLLPKAD